MRSNLSKSVAGYLRTIAPSQGKPIAYYKLDRSGYVVDHGGDTDLGGIANLDEASPIDEQVPVLSGLLPVDAIPLIVPNVQLVQGKFIDIHIYGDENWQWIVLIDNTEAATVLQEQQQNRLADEIIKEIEKKSKD